MYNYKSAFSYLEMIKALLNGEQLESEFCESIEQDEQDKVRNVLKEITDLYDFCPEWGTYLEGAE